MRKPILLLMALFLVGTVNLSAQIATYYFNEGPDKRVDTIIAFTRPISLADGTFGLIAQANDGGAANLDYAAFRIDLDGQLTTSTFVNIPGRQVVQASTLATDGTAWAGGYDDSGDRKPLFVQFSADLSEVAKTIIVATDTLAIFPQAMVANASHIVAFSSQSRISDNEFLGYYLTSFDATTGSIMSNELLSSSFIRENRNFWLTPIDDDQFAIATLNDNQDSLLIRELSFADLSENRSEWYAMSDFCGSASAPRSNMVYLPEQDAYAAATACSAIGLYPRPGAADTLPEILTHPANSGNLFNGILQKTGEGLFLYADNRGDNYDIVLDGAGIDTIIVYPRTLVARRISRSLLSPDGSILFSVTTQNNADGFNLIVGDLIADTIITDSIPGLDGSRLIRDFVSIADIKAYQGAGPGGVDLVLGRGSNFTGPINTVPVFNGSTGQVLGVLRAQDFIDSIFVDNSNPPQNYTIELSNAVPLTNGNYLSSGTENRVSRIAVLFDENFAPIGNGAFLGGINPIYSFPNIFDNLVTSQATSYGIVTVNAFGGSNTETNQFDYVNFIQGVDSNLNEVFYLELPPGRIYPFGRHPIAVSSSDDVYIGATASGPGNTFSQDSIRLLALTDGDSIRYTTSLGNPLISSFRVSSLELNDQETALLMAGNAVDTANNRYAFIYEFEVASGALVSDTLITAADLGYQSIFFASASYRDGGETFLFTYGSATVENGGQNLILGTILDPDGATIEQEIISESPLFYNSENIAVAGDVVYTGGTFSDPTTLGTNYFLARIALGEATEVKDEVSLGEELKLTVSPNPTRGPLRINWEQPTAGRYEMRLHDLNGRVLRQSNGWLPEGTITLNEDLSDLPSGYYFLRIQTPTGPMLSTIVKP